MIEENRVKATHNIILENRKNLTVSAVKDVDSYDEKAIIMFTELGMLVVKGSDLHINRFNTQSGELVLEGSIDSLTYSEQEKRTASSFMSKLFK